MTPRKKPWSLFRALKAGMALIATGTGAARTWSLSDGRDVDPHAAAALIAVRFLGGRLRPSNDGLPGLVPDSSQTWRWQPDPPAGTRKRGPNASAAPGLL